MSKLIDITDKLNFEEKPSVRVKNVDLESTMTQFQCSKLRHF